jgi:hypothetical protein
MQAARLAADQGNSRMSVTHPDVAIAPVPHRGFAERHPQLAPFVLAVAIAVVSVFATLAFTGLPA